jgi:hypothetical protein
VDFDTWYEFFKARLNYCVGGDAGYCDKKACRRDYYEQGYTPQDAADAGYDAMCCLG